MSAKGAGADLARLAKFALRVFVSAGFMVFLLRWVDLKGIAKALSDISGLLFGLACLLFLCGQAINTERWRKLLLMARGFAPARRYLLGLVLAGMFFNFFLPSTVGGDVVRAEMAKKRLGGRAEAYMSIATARMLALIAVLVIGFVASLVAWQRFGWFDRDLTLGILVFLSPAVAIFLVTRIPVANRLKSATWLPVSRLQNTSFVMRSFRAYTRSRSGLAWVFALSVLAQFVGNVFVVWVLAASLGIAAPIVFHMVAVPLITLIVLLPISLNGIGVREGGFVFFFAKVGVAGDDAVALSLAYTLVLVVFSIFGGFCLIFGRRDKAATERFGPNP